MPSPGPPIRRGAVERFQAWLVTGPLGHLWSVAIDVVRLWVRYGLARLRGRTPYT